MWAMSSKNIFNFCCTCLFPSKLGRFLICIISKFFVLLMTQSLVYQYIFIIKLFADIYVKLSMYYTNKLQSYVVRVNLLIVLSWYKCSETKPVVLAVILKLPFSKHISFVNIRGNNVGKGITSKVVVLLQKPLGVYHIGENYCSYLL